MFHINSSINSTKEIDPYYILSNPPTHIDLIKTFNKFTIVILYFEMILCFILNTISILYITTTKLFNPINILIINLALGDLLYASLVPIFARQFRQVSGENLIQTKFSCQISYFLDVTCMLVIF